MKGADQQMKKKKDKFPPIEIREGDIVKKSDSYTESCHFLMHQHINGAGRLFGGTLMQWIDETAGVVARRHCNAPLVTACIDNLIFKEGAHLSDFVVLTGRITYVGNSSMEVRVGVPRYIPQDVRARVEWENGRKRQELRTKRRLEGY